MRLFNLCGRGRERLGPCERRVDFLDGAAASLDPDQKLGRTPPISARNWKFESSPLQGRVCKPSLPLDASRERRADGSPGNFP